MHVRGKNRKKYNEIISKSHGMHVRKKQEEIQ
jgi:hypothetical protein